MTVGASLLQLVINPVLTICGTHPPEYRGSDEYKEDFLTAVIKPPQESEECEDFDPIFDFIVAYLPGLYGGWAAINKWIDQHKGKSYVNLVTTSCLAYAIVVIENSKDKWDEQYEISLKLKSKEEQEKYKRVKSLPPGEREQYTKTARPKFTDRQQSKIKFGGHGWSKEGVNHHKSIQFAWKAAFENKTYREKYEIAWDEYVESTGASKHWKERGPSQEDPEEEEECEPLTADTFAIPDEEELEDEGEGDGDAGSKWGGDYSASDDDGNDYGDEEENSDEEGEGHELRPKKRSKFSHRVSY